MAADLLATALYETAQSWLLTYLLHSTLLLGSAWVVCRLLRRLPVAMQDSLWRTALLGGLITATAQVALGFEAYGGRVEISEPVAVTIEATPEPLLEPLATFEVPVEPAGLPTPAAPIEAPAAATRHWTTYVPALIAVLWGLGALIALVRFARARHTLRVRMAHRTPLADGPLRAVLDRLTASAGFRRHVRLTQATGLASPVALGFGRREICLPERAIEGLAPAHQEVMLAHELAHHLRSDPLWLAVGRWIEALFFFQPLNAVANRRLRENAEILCDQWAVEATGRRRELAECLTLVAEWVLARRAALPLPAMAQRGAALEQRVRRLLDDAHDVSRVRAAWRIGAVLLPLLAVTLLAPAIGRASTGSSTEDTLPLEAHRPIADLAGALDALDEETAALRDELTALIALVERAGAREPLLERGVAVLRQRLGTLDADRTALLKRIRLHLETNR